jgi:hypothetical protein
MHKRKKPQLLDESAVEYQIYPPCNAHLLAKPPAQRHVPPPSVRPFVAMQTISLHAMLFHDTSSTQTSNQCAAILSLTNADKKTGMQNRRGRSVSGWESSQRLALITPHALLHHHIQARDIIRARYKSIRRHILAIGGDHVRRITCRIFRPARALASSSLSLSLSLYVSTWAARTYKTGSQPLGCNWRIGPGSPGDRGLCMRES